MTCRPLFQGPERPFEVQPVGEGGCRRRRWPGCPRELGMFREPVRGLGLRVPDSRSGQVRLCHTLHVTRILVAVFDLGDAMFRGKGRCPSVVAGSDSVVDYLRVACGGDDECHGGRSWRPRVSRYLGHHPASSLWVGWPAASCDV